MPLSRLLLLALVFGLPVYSFAEDITLRGLERGRAYTLEVAADGSVKVTPARIVTVGTPPNPLPTPDPAPPPTSVLTTRGKAIQAEAIKVGDPETAKGLAELYRQLATLGRNNGPLKDPANLKTAVTFGTDTLLGPLKAPAWQKTRDVLAIQWSQVQGGDYCTLLDEAASGLDAVDRNQAISPEMWKFIIEVLLPLILKLFFKP